MSFTNFSTLGGGERFCERVASRAMSVAVYQRPLSEGRNLRPAQDGERAAHKREHGDVADHHNVRALARRNDGNSVGAALREEIEQRPGHRSPLAG